jgi:hypothetical protein
MGAEVEYYNTKNKKENVMEGRIEELEKELAALKAQLGKKYEPKPGNYCILGDGYIEYLDDWGNYAKNGRAFDTKEKAEKARDIMVKHDIILKYVIDHTPNYATDWNNFAEKKWVINYCVESKKWDIEFWEAYNSFGMIVMPKWVAKKLADDLNNNRIDGI